MNKSFFGILFIAISLFLFTSEIYSQKELNVVPNWYYFKNSPNSLYDHFSNEALKLLEERHQTVAKIQTIAEWQERQKWIKKTMVDIIGPFPGKTPLNPRITKTIKKQKFTVEHIVFESQPGFKVTSSLYIPASLKKKEKAPVIIYCSGHSDNGYRSNVYQHVITNLVYKGFLVFAFDPVGQGERLQYFNPKTGKSDIGSATAEHSHSGAQVFITGSSLAMHMIWDGIRAVDYLLTRKEVDPERIGITGRSGGGTQSAYIAAMDDRIYATAPECYITNLTRLFQSIGPQDAEQNLYKAIYRGIDHPDYLIVRAPKPALMITTVNDFFSIQGARETAEEVSRIYKAFGKAENFSMTEDIDIHASTKKNRETMYAFFQKHLNNPGSSEDEECELLTEEELRVTDTGQLSTSPGSETIFSLNVKEAEKLNTNLQLSRSNLNTHLPEVLKSSRMLSGFAEPKEIKGPFHTGSIQREDYLIEKYFIQGEGEYIIPYLLYLPESPNRKALIYLHPAGKNADSASITEIEWFVKQGYTVLSPDLLGMGETGGDNFFTKVSGGSVTYKFWFASILVNKSITGVWAGDIIRLCRVLENNNSVTDILALAKGITVPALLHAAVFNPGIRHIALIDPLSSYNTLVMNRFYATFNIHAAIAGLLQSYDLPDLAACIAPRKLLFAGVVNGEGKLLNQVELNEELSIVKTAYTNKNAEKNLKIMLPEMILPFPDLYKTWLNED